MSNPGLRAALRVFAAINSRDLACVPECVTDDFVDHGGVPFPVLAGPEGYVQILRFVTQVLKISYEIEDVIATDDRIVIRALASGVGVSSFHGPGADGQEFRMETIHIYRNEGDRLAEHWGVRDELGAIRRMGLIPERPRH